MIGVKSHIAMQGIVKTRIKTMLERVKKSPLPTTFLTLLSPEALPGNFAFT